MEFVSDGCRDITGYDAADLIQNQTLSYRDLIYSKDRDMVWEEISRALQERRHFQISYRIQTRVGEEKWVWEQGDGVYPPVGDEPIAVEGIVVDITPRRAVTRQIETQDRLATVGRMATGIAHDFNNIMSIITLYSGLLERQPDHPRRAQYLSLISQQAYHASRLIRQLLDYSRNSIVEQQAINLASFLEEMVVLLQRTVPDNVTVEFHCLVDEAFVRADPTRLQQVMINIAFNARDAMPHGGALSVFLDTLNVRTGDRPGGLELEPGRWVRVQMADTGFGIAAEILPRIFEPFYTTKEPGRGTGMGLAQVQGIVEELGGAIGVQSCLGEGTTFSILLPALPSTEGAAADHDFAPAATARVDTVLIAEDNEATREAVAETVAGLGYRVLVASSGRQALELFAEHGENIDLLLADIVMPEMGGIDLSQRIHQQWPGVHCMLMSGYPLDRERQRLLEERSIFWIQKPFTMETLAESLRLVLGA
jgi:two-component system, cell cycle sensor histidine kinase and response regulator CckA